MNIRMRNTSIALFPTGSFRHTQFCEKKVSVLIWLASYVVVASRASAGARLVGLKVRGDLFMSCDVNVLIKRS